MAIILAADSLERKERRGIGYPFRAVPAMLENHPMDNEPEIPPPPPEVPSGKLWVSLGVPPLVTVIGTFLLSLIFGDKNYGIEILLMLPIGLIAIITCLVFFILAWRVRYRGRTLVLTSIGYFLGQIILCLCLWYGCCFAVLA